MGCSAGELGPCYCLPLVPCSYHYCHAYYCLASIVEMAILNKCTHSFQNVSSQVTLASIPYSLDIMPPFEYNPSPLYFLQKFVAEVYFSPIIHCYYVSALICPVVQVDYTCTTWFWSLCYTQPHCIRIMRHSNVLT